MIPVIFLAQTATENESGFAGYLLVVIIFGVILGLYFLNRSSRRKADAAYWHQRTFEDRLKANDPDMRKDDA